MFIRFIAAIATITAVMFASPAWPPGVPSDWTVLNTTLNVRYTLDKIEWHPVTSGRLLPNKSWIDTGPRGRITLNRGMDTINLSPGTYAGIFNLAGPRDKTVVFQQSGGVTLDIEHESKPRMLVTTPFLGALVRGTKFSVTISNDQSKVVVKHGTVQVTEFRTGQQQDVSTGQAATVDPSGSRDMFVDVVGTEDSAHKAQTMADGTSAPTANRWTPPQNTFAVAHANPDGSYDAGNFDIVSVAKSSNQYFQTNDISISFELFILSLLIVPFGVDLINRTLRTTVKAT